MEYAFGKGRYIEGTRHREGQIVVDEHKLYVRGEKADFTTTYTPLEKIEKIRKTRQGIELEVKLSAANSFKALIRGEERQLSELVKYLVQKLNLRKKFFKNEWTGEAFWR